MRAVATSLLAVARQPLAPHLLWMDGAASHFGGSPSGEFQGHDSCIAGERAPATAARHGAAFYGVTACRAHRCSSTGGGNAASLPVVRGAGIATVLTYHAARLAPVAHSGVPFRNFSRWKAPDCAHLCQPSGPDDLRTSLVYNQIVSGHLFRRRPNATRAEAMPEAGPARAPHAARPAAAACTVVNGCCRRHPRACSSQTHLPNQSGVAMLQTHS